MRVCTSPPLLKTGIPSWPAQCWHPEVTHPLVTWFGWGCDIEEMDGAGQTEPQGTKRRKDGSLSQSWCGSDNEKLRKEKEVKPTRQ